MVDFVDNSTGQVNIFIQESTTPEYILQLMRHDAQLWNDLLWVSDSLLELEKCSYHLLHWKFEASRRPFLLTSDPDTPLQ
eukprot:8226480-Ditylum_brightwellii.AAC.1